MYTVEVKDMVSSDAAPGVQPSHKITYTEGSNQFWFYYFMRTPECRPFIRMKDDELVKHMYPKGIALKIEGFPLPIDPLCKLVVPMRVMIVVIRHLLE